VTALPLLLHESHEQAREAKRVGLLHFSVPIRSLGLGRLPVVSSRRQGGSRRRGSASPFSSPRLEPQFVAGALGAAGAPGGGSAPTIGCRRRLFPTARRIPAARLRVSLLLPPGSRLSSRQVPQAPCPPRPIPLASMRHASQKFRITGRVSFFPLHVLLCLVRLETKWKARTN